MAAAGPGAEQVRGQQLASDCGRIRIVASGEQARRARRHLRQEELREAPAAGAREEALLLLVVAQMAAAFGVPIAAARRR